MQEHDIVIIGGGPAGLSAAYSAASNGSSVLLIEKDDGIGVNVRTSGVSWINEMNKLILLSLSLSFYYPFTAFYLLHLLIITLEL